MPDDATKLLDEIQARADAATKGPWEWLVDSDSISEYGMGVKGDTEVFLEAETLSVCGKVYVGIRAKQEDRALIAHAREDIPRLVAAVRAVNDIPENMRINIGGEDVVPVKWLRGMLADALRSDRPEPCPKCGGTGCLDTPWSDSDPCCEECAGSGEVELEKESHND